MIDEPIFIIVVLLVGIFFGTVIGGGLAETRESKVEEKEFIADCQKYHKPYECIKMWRDG
jgi:hypothetical protein